VARRGRLTFIPRRERMFICLDAPGTNSESSFSLKAICDVGGMREEPEAAARERNSRRSSLVEETIMK
jgi:hypothetical protein